MSDVADKLAEARARVERAWVQRDYACGTGVCSVGAIQAVVNGDPDDCTCSYMVRQVEVFLRKAIDRPSIIAWNDAPGRTQAEVIEAFRKAEELARKEPTNA